MDYLKINWDRDHSALELFIVILIAFYFVFLICLTFIFQP
ncbi:hypothetical protein L579_3689 [Pantoea sp. AS-PWVM4]|nr:hypothetical protein L579_3689 [Pantoea sp. AS-PWVM4]